MPACRSDDGVPEPERFRVQTNIAPAGYDGSNDIGLAARRSKRNGAEPVTDTVDLRGDGMQPAGVGQGEIVGEESSRFPLRRCVDHLTNATLVEEGIELRSVHL